MTWISSKQITNEIEKGRRSPVECGSSKATNRTVVTFCGEPVNVIEAAYQAIKKPGSW